MSATLEKRRQDRGPTAIEGVALLTAIVGVMWLVQVINVVDSYGLDRDGLVPRNIDRIYGIFTAPFLHASWQHLIDNTIPLVFMGLIIALAGARRLAIVTAIVIVVGGIGTWLIAPAGSITVGASGVVFGYATYLLTRGIFDRSVVEILTGAVVGVVWGGALLASVVPHYGVSWQAHVCGGIAGVIAAAVLSRQAPAKKPGSTGGPGGPVSGSGPGGSVSALDRALMS